MTSNVRVEILTKQNYTMGEPVDVSIVISNIGSETIPLYKPATLCGVLRNDLFYIQSNDEKMEYHGALFRSTKEAGIIYLNSIQNISFSTKLAKEYCLDQSGTYSVELIKDKLVYNSSSDLGYSAPIVYFDLYIQDNPPISTYAQNAQKLSKSNIKCSDFGNGHCIYNAVSQKEVNDTREAHFAAENILSHISTNFIDPLTDSFKTAYDSVFCKNDYSAAAKLLTTYKEMHSYMNHSIKYWYKGKDCEPGDYAYIIRADALKNIYLCSVYEQVQTIPNEIKPYDSKAGVILHEISHKSSSSKDHFYSYETCENKATTCSSLTITNADCIQIFAELVMVGDLSSSCLA